MSQRATASYVDAKNKKAPPAEAERGQVTP